MSNRADILEALAERVERVAIAMREADTLRATGRKPYIAWADESHTVRHVWTVRAKAATAALTPAGEDEVERVAAAIGAIPVNMSMTIAGIIADGSPNADLSEILRDAALAALSRPNVDDILAGSGWVYSNDGADEEYAPSHPVESGEVPGATNIRRSTQMEDALNDHVQRLFQTTLSRPNVDEGALPKLTDAMITAAAEAHYGPRRVRAVGGIDGVDLTVNDENYTFRQGFMRMWRGINRHLQERAALNGSGNHG